MLFRPAITTIRYAKIIARPGERAILNHFAKSPVSEAFTRSISTENSLTPLHEIFSSQKLCSNYKRLE